MHAALQVDHLVVEYPGVRALDGVSFTLPAGSITALVGPNGAGKTTLMRCIVALERPFSGHVTVAGHDTVRTPREVHRRVGYLSDDFGLYDDLTVAACVRYAGEAHGLRAAVLEARLAEVKEATELEGLWAQRAGSLSRGQRQRVGLALALIHDPSLVVLDEPASGLDPGARAGLGSLITRLGRAGKTLVVSSHILAELEDYATWMLTLEGGQLRGHVPVQATPAAGTRWLRLRIAGEASHAVTLAREVPGVASAEAVAGGVRVAWEREEAAQAGLLLSLLQQGVPVVGLEAEGTRMQDLYLDQVGGRREEGP